MVVDMEGDGGRRELSHIFGAALGLLATGTAPMVAALLWVAVMQRLQPFRPGVKVLAFSQQQSSRRWSHPKALKSLRLNFLPNKADQG
jgi:hypothetical protein